MKSQFELFIQGLQSWVGIEQRYHEGRDYGRDPDKKIDHDHADVGRRRNGEVEGNRIHHRRHRPTIKKEQRHHSVHVIASDEIIK